MKILIISGTPKLEGLTYSFVKAAEGTTVESGNEAEVIRLSGMDLTKCKMCGDGWGSCFSEHKCKFGDADGFNELQNKVRDADAFVYITPVYWGEISEDMKIFFDKLRRCQATKQWDDKIDEGSALSGKTGIMVAVAGGGGGGIVSTFSDIERAVSHMGGNIFDYIAVNRWNQEYKREALIAAVKTLISHKK